MMVLTNLLMLGVLFSSTVSAVIQYNGFVVDYYCWLLPNRRGLDGAPLGTNPGAHSTHCMRDVQPCIDDGYMIVEPKVNGPYTYDLKYRFDKAGNDMLLQIVQTTTKQNQLRVTVVGEEMPNQFLAVQSMILEDTISTPLLSTSSTPTVAQTIRPTEPNVIRYNGFVVDYYCWLLPNRIGLDGAPLGTNPGAHSTHCMRDVPECIENGYMIVEPKANGPYAYDLKYRFDKAGNDMLLKIVQTTTKKNQLRVTVVGVEMPNQFLAVQSMVLEDSMSTSSTSEVLSIGLGVGLGVGIPLLIALGYVLYVRIIAQSGSDTGNVNAAKGMTVVQPAKIPTSEEGAIAKDEDRAIQMATI